MTVSPIRLKQTGNRIQRWCWPLALIIAVISLLLARRVSQEVRNER